jgi:hypothetical protein
MQIQKGFTELAKILLICHAVKVADLFSKYHKAT